MRETLANFSMTGLMPNYPACYHYNNQIESFPTVHNMPMLYHNIGIVPQVFYHPGHVFRAIGIQNIQSSNFDTFFLIVRRSG